MTRTVQAIYEDGVLRLMEPVALQLQQSARVRVRIEMPEPAAEASPERRLSPEKRGLLRRIRRLRDATPPLPFDIVAALREMRDNG